MDYSVELILVHAPEVMPGSQAPLGRKSVSTNVNRDADIRFNRPDSRYLLAEAENATCSQLKMLRVRRRTEAAALSDSFWLIIQVLRSRTYMTVPISPQSISSAQRSKIGAGTAAMPGTFTITARADDAAGAKPASPL